MFQIMMMFLEKNEEFTGQNSNWTTFRINYLRLCWGPYRPMMEGSFIPTPKWIFAKHAVVNIRCSDDHNSFQYSVLVGMNLINSFARRTTKCRSSQYAPFMKMLNINGIPTPVHSSYIDMFEKQNPEISVNVQYYIESKRDIIIIRTSKFGSLRKFHVNLLMITDRDNFHYVNIESLSRLHGHHGTSRCRSKRHFCQYCLHGFSRDYYLRKHLQI